MFNCTQDGCTGHLGKFPDCLTEALWQLSMSGMLGEPTGDVEYEGHYTLMIFDESLTEPLDNGPAVTVPTGYYLLGTDGQGFVWLQAYDTEAEAREIFDEIDARYAAWSEVDDC